MRRADYVYVVAAGDVLYVGQATTPGRALAHWFGSHNARLRAAVETSLAADRWPRLRILLLPDPNLEDLNNAETMLIALLRDDRRTASRTVNGSPGRSLFSLVRWDDPDVRAERPGGLSVDWFEHRSGDRHEYELASVQGHAPGSPPATGQVREVSRPFLSPRNARAVQHAAPGLLGAPAAGTAPWQSFFQHLPAFVPGLDDLPDPVGGPITLRQLAARLGAPYVLVNLRTDALDERGSVGAGLTEPVLRARAEKWWTPGSLSLTPGPGGSLRSAPNAPDSRRPRYVVATVGGTGGRRVVLAVWPLRDEPWGADPARPDLAHKLVLPIGPPDPGDAATARGARSIGVLLQDTASLGGRGALWVDTDGSGVD